MMRRWHHKGRDLPRSVHTKRRRPLSHRFSFLLVVLYTAPWGAYGALHGQDEGLTFDTSVLSSRGVDPGIAALFTHAPRFMSGESRVNLTVNGASRGQIKVRFDEVGRLCADHSFLHAAGLTTPHGYADNIACFDLRTAWPNTVVKLEPGDGHIILIVPPEALNAIRAEDSNWQHGGIAGMLNYNAQYLSSTGNGHSLHFGQLDTEAGFNAGGWIVRSRQTFTRFNDKNQVNHQAIYTQRSFFDTKKVLQVGQISLSNSLFGTGQVFGFQMFPDAALVPSQSGAGWVEGVALAPSAVEVRQSGALVYSTAVPSGPFKLQGFSLLNTRTDLEVTLTDSTGQSRRFIVPATTLQVNALRVSPGWSFGTGQLDQQDGKTPFLVTLSSDWPLAPFNHLSVGVLGSAPYRAGALNLDTQLFAPTRLNLLGVLAQDADHSDTGILLSTQFSHKLSDHLSVNFNGQQQTQGYSELSDALLRTSRYNVGSQSRNHYQWGSSINWSTEGLGNLSLSWVRNTTFSGHNTYYLRSGWNHQFGRVHLGVSLEHNAGSFNGQADDRLYVSFSMPLGEGRDINSYLNTAKHSTRTGIRYSDRTNQDLVWSIAADRDQRNRQISLSGNINYVTSVSQLNASVSHDSDNYTSWVARASGAAALHEDGITLSPYRVTETFGIVQVGNESQVRLDTPAGPVWTDRRGYAVLPTLNGYGHSSIQVDTHSLAKNVDIDNAWQEAEIARGAIGRVNFEVIRTRRVLIDVTREDGRPLPQGASVFNDSGELVTVVGYGGTVFVPDAAPGITLEVQSSGKTVCTIKLDLPETVEATGLYENALASCR